MLSQTFVIYDKYNGHIVCDVNDNYKVFDSESDAQLYIQDRNLNYLWFVVRRSDNFDQRTAKAIQSVKV